MIIVGFPLGFFVRNAVILRSGALQTLQQTRTRRSKNEGSRKIYLNGRTFMCNDDYMRTKPILGFPAYRIREDGILETRWEWGPHYPGMTKQNKWKRLSLKVNEKGYIPVSLRDVGGKRRRTHIHRLIVETFISPPPFENSCVRHIDGNSLNNSLSNLIWGTYLENENDKKRHGTHKKRISNAKLNKELMTKIDEMRAKGSTQLEIAKAVGVSRPTISRYLSGKTWGDV